MSCSGYQMNASQLPHHHSRLSLRPLRPHPDPPSLPPNQRYQASRFGNFLKEHIS